MIEYLLRADPVLPQIEQGSCTVDDQPTCFICLEQFSPTGVVCENCNMQVHYDCKWKRHRVGCDGCWYGDD